MSETSLSNQSTEQLAVQTSDELMVEVLSACRDDLAATNSAVAQKNLQRFFVRFAYEHAEDAQYTESLEKIERLYSVWCRHDDLEAAIATIEKPIESDHNRQRSIWHDIAETAERLEIGDDIAKNVAFLQRNEHPLGIDVMPWADGTHILHNGRVIRIIEDEDMWFYGRHTSRRGRALMMFLGLRPPRESLIDMTRAKQNAADTWRLIELRAKAGLGDHPDTYWSREEPVKDQPPLQLIKLGRLMLST